MEGGGERHSRNHWVGIHKGTVVRTGLGISLYGLTTALTGRQKDPRLSAKIHLAGFFPAESMLNPVSHEFPLTMKR
jgi:hypothetical protein